MNYLARIRKDVTSFNLATSPITSPPTKQFAQDELIRNVVNLLTNEGERKQFLEQIQAAILMPFNHDNLIAETSTIEKRATIPSTIINEADTQWLAAVHQHIATSISEFEFTLERLSRLIYLSPRQIRRRLKRLTGKTFSQLLKEARLKEALRLLENREVKSIKKVAYQVGLKDVKYFSKQFKLYFGTVPSTYLGI